MELWYFGMSFAGKSVHGWVGETGTSGGHYPPPWRTSCSLVGCVLQSVISVIFDLIKVWVFALKRQHAHRPRGAHPPHDPLPLLRSLEAGTLFHPISTLISQHHWAVDPSILLRSRGLYLTLAQWLGLRSASLGWPFMRSCCVSVVRRRLQRAVSVVAGRTDLAAAVGVVVWNGRRSFHDWMGRTVGLNGFRFDLISRGQLSAVHWVTRTVASNTVLTATVFPLRVAGAAAGGGGRRWRRPARRHALRLVK